MKNNPETLALAMDYVTVMEACAAYVLVKKPEVRTPSDVFSIVRPILTTATGGDKQESFLVLMLDTKYRLFDAPVEATRGILDSSLVHPREVFREAVRVSAAAVILAHNHPSGDPTPSKEDIIITRRLVEAGNIIGIRVADHVVCGHPGTDPESPGYVSLREKNLVDFN